MRVRSAECGVRPGATPGVGVQPIASARRATQPRPRAGRRLARTPHSALRTSSAFTLIEVILAIGLTVGLVGTMYGVYHRMLQVRDAAQRQMDMLLAERLIMDSITTELRTAMELQFLNIGLEGDAASATWTCTQLPGRHVWAERGATDDPLPISSDLAIVGYRLRTTVDEDSGEDIVVGLERTVQRIITASVVEEDDEETTSSNAPAEMGERAASEDDGQSALQVELLSGNLKYLAFRYYDGSAWVESWTGGDLPAAVEITLGVEPIGEDESVEDYELRAELYRRTVFVPSGVRAATGGVVRGLGGGVRG